MLLAAQLGDGEAARVALKAARGRTTRRPTASRRCTTRCSRESIGRMLVSRGRRRPERRGARRHDARARRGRVQLAGRPRAAAALRRARRRAGRRGVLRHDRRRAKPATSRCSRSSSPPAPTRMWRRWPQGWWPPHRGAGGRAARLALDARCGADASLEDETIAKCYPPRIDGVGPSRSSCYWPRTPTPTTRRGRWRCTRGAGPEDVQTSGGDVGGTCVNSRTPPSGRR